MGGNTIYIGQPVISATSYAVPFIGSTGLLDQDPTKFKYDKTNNYLSLHGGGVGTASALLHVLGTTTSHIGKFDIGVDFDAVAQPTTAPGLALIASAGNINVGTHYYRITYKTAVGETQLNTGTGATTTYIVTDAGHAQVTVTLPVSSDYRVTHVCIYRAVTGNIYYNDVKKVGEVANGVTTFVDNIADSSRTGVNSFARSNTTNRFITVDGSPSMFVSSTDTYLGYRAGEGAILGTAGGGENTFFGASVGTNPLGTKNVAIGTSVSVGSSDSSVLIGHSAGGIGTNFYNGIIMGRNTAFWNTYNMNSVILGGAKGTTYYQASYITNVGMESLSSITTGANSVVVLGAFSARNLTIGAGSIVIGTYVDLPSATTTGQLNIGNVIYGLGMYNVLASSSAPTSNGSIGIARNTTGASRLELAAGTTSISPLKLFAGTNKTTAAAGEFEFDGTSLFFTPSTIRNTVALLQTTQTWTATQTFTMPSTVAPAIIAKAVASPATDLLQFQKSDGTVFGWFSAQNAGTYGNGVLTVKDKGIADITTTAFHTDDQNAYSLSLYNDTTSAFFAGFSVFTYNSGHTTVSNENFAPLSFCTNGIGNYRIYIAAAGQVGFGGITSPTAVVHLAAGSATASTAPLKFNSGTNLTVAEAGATEFDGTQLFFTPSITRNILTQVSGSTALAIGSIPFATTSGYLTEDNSKFFWDNTNKSLGIGTNTPTARLHLPAGTTATSNAPLKFTSGSFQTVTEAGTVEFLAERFTIAPTSLARMSIVGTLFTQTADTTVANTTTETTLFGTGVAVGGGLTLPANFFVAGKTIKIHIRGYHSSTGNPNVTFKVKLGSTVVATGTGVSGNGSTSGFYFDSEITCRTTGATGTVSAGAQYNEVHSSGLNLGIVQTGTTTIDTTASHVLDVTITWGTANAGNTITSQISYVTIIN